MIGTAILYKPDKKIVIIEDIEKEKYEELRKQCSCTVRSSKSNGNKIVAEKITPVLWHEDDVDWDYGY
ncbi:hypothetical protein [Bacillus sp. PS06]|uniref:hypothetical protein n=1 Tax=Bacillus sp. PS06 TaxID=2764176 RepID=UPI00177E60A2|nr:hypothetical protein [Bacillus sp. PS06]MBD8068492.1 hypothetical protein [Bacillus sp. PS06]